MSVRIFRDVEESLAREVRRITFHEQRTVDQVVLPDTFDPFTGEIVPMPIEPDFYDSSADTKDIQYPHFFIRLLKTREDRHTGRIVPPYGQWCKTPVGTSPGAYEILAQESDGLVAAPGNEMQTGLFQISKVQPGHFIRFLAGNNKGTYIVDSVTKSSSGPHSIFVKNVLLENLPAVLFSLSDRAVVFTTAIDLNTVKVGDTFTDASVNSYTITAVDISSNSVTIDGAGSPDLAAASTISRSGNVFQAADPSLLRFLILDPSQPITIATNEGEQESNSEFVGISPAIPLDAYYMIRIDSKERETHIDVLNRIWEEFNPPKTGLPVIVRTALSAEQQLTQDIPSGGSTIINIGDSSNYNLNENVYIFDDIMPSKSDEGLFERPYEYTIIGIPSATQLELSDTVPDRFTIDNNTKIVSNSEFKLFMFNFVDHATRDREGAQYWVHEFTFWVQVWVKRLEEAEQTGAVHDIATPIGTIDGHIIFEDN